MVQCLEEKGTLLTTPSDHSYKWLFKVDTEDVLYEYYMNVSLQKALAYQQFNGF